MRAISLAACLTLFLVGPAYADEETAREAPIIMPAELQAQLDKGNAPLVIDVRSAAEFATGHIPGSVNIPHNEIAARISELEAPNGVALYCMIGPRARLGGAALLASGYEAVLHIEGGLSAWKASGLPVEGAP